jgi:hypothetical protein
MGKEQTFASYNTKLPNVTEWGKKIGFGMYDPLGKEKKKKHFMS